MHDVGHRYLGVLGCIINDDTYQQSVVPRIDEIKARHFSAGSAAVFHRKDLLHARGHFSCLAEATARAAFDDDLIEAIGSLQYGLICVVIDKQNHIDRYNRHAFPPYHYCMKLMLERYCYFLNRFGCSGDVMAECRGKTEDRQLQDAFSAVYAGGTEEHPATFFNGTLTSKEIKFRKKLHNDNGLQLADLLAHPLRHAVLQAFGKAEAENGTCGARIREAVKDKYNRNFNTGCVLGYGMVLK